jgi:hypothetical protein
MAAPGAFNFFASATALAIACFAPARSRVFWFAVCACAEVAVNKASNNPNVIDTIDMICFLPGLAVRPCCELDALLKKRDAEKTRQKTKTKRQVSGGKSDWRGSEN